MNPTVLNFENWDLTSSFFLGGALFVAILVGKISSTRIWHMGFGGTVESNIHGWGPEMCTV